MTQPSVSIIIPVFNVESYVEDCIRSVMHQTYTGPLECILVDDCGSDDSMVKAEKLIFDYNGPISFIVIRHDHNRGLSAARNTGMDAATGDYLFFLDSDDELTEDCIEMLVKPLNQECYDVVVGNVTCFNEVSAGCYEKEKNLEFDITNDVLLRSPAVIDSIIKWKNVTAWNRLFRASFIKENSLVFKEGMVHEDNLWSLQVASLASSFYLLNRATYIYKRRKGSITHPFNKERKMESLIEVIKEMRSFVEDRHLSEALVFPEINKYFTEVLRFHSSSLSGFIETYNRVRPSILVSLTVLAKARERLFRKLLYDFHYLLPQKVAPYWQFAIFTRHRR